MSIVYPGTLDTLTNPTSSQYFDSPSHSGQHSDINDAVEAIETKIGVGSGTPTVNKIMVGSGNGTSTWSATWNAATLGTPSITGGTINNVILGTPSVSGGTITSLIGTSQITGGTVTGATLGTNSIIGGTINTVTVGTPTVTGGTFTSGTFNSAIVGTPAITGGTISGAALIGTVKITGGTVTGAQLGTNTITGGTATSTVLNTNTIGTPSITGGTATNTVLNSNTIGTPTVTGGNMNLVTFGTPTLVMGSDAMGDIYYRSSAGTVSRLAVGTLGQILKVSAGTLPSWDDNAAAGVTSVVTGSNLTGGTITSTGTISLAGTIQPTMIGTTLIQGGTVANALVGTSTITGGTATSTVLNSNTVGTPIITGGTINLSTLGTPKISMIQDTNGNEVLGLQASGTAVNYINIVNSAAGNVVQVAGVGDDANVSLTLATKGAGTLRLYPGTGASSGHIVPAIADDTLAVLAGTQTFTNKTLTSPTVNTPTLVLANSVPTADGGIGFDRTNEDLAVGDGAAGQLVHMGAWKTWVPSWTNVTIGSATVVASYCQIGKLVKCRLSVVWAADTSASGSFIFSLPVTSISYPATAVTNVLGNCFILDAGTGAFGGQVNWASTTTATVRYFDASALITAFSSTAPMTWTTNDVLGISFSYEAA